MECHQVNNIDECIELATCDAYGEAEQAAAWLECMDEVFQGVTEVKVFGEVVRFVGFDIEGIGLVAICAKGRHRARVTLDSISPQRATPAQKLWLRAWKAWQK